MQFDTETERSQGFYEPLGRIVVLFASLDNSLGLQMYTLLNENPLVITSSSVQIIQGPMSQEAFSLVISGMTTMEKIQIVKRLALLRFPDKKTEIRALIKQLETVTTQRNELVHYHWYVLGQIGLTLSGKFVHKRRTPEELVALGDDLKTLCNKVMWLHETLLGIGPH